MSRPRRHHFVPKFYLNGFTDTGDENGTLYVSDRWQLKRWRTRPINAAHQRDLYEVSSDGSTDPSAFEKMFAKLEGQFQPVIRWVIENQQLPHNDAWNVLLNFLTMMTIRVPRIKNAMEELNDTVHKRAVRSQIASTDGWEAFKQSIKDSGGKLDGVDETKLREFINSEDYTITQGQNWYLSMMVDASKTVLPMLTARKWVLRQVADGVPDLVTSDFPLTINEGTSYPKGGFMPGLAHRNTLVTFPIHKRSAMIGAFEEELLSTPLERHNVANLNTATSRYASQIYSSDADYVCLVGDGRIQNGSEILQTWKSRGR